MVDPRLDRRDKSELEQKIEKLEEEVAVLKHLITTLTTAIEGLVSAWDTAKGITSFVKWVGSLSTGAAVLWAILHGVPPK